MISILAQVPVPRDIPLPLPADTIVLEGLIILLFLVHILFVNLMLGCSVLGVTCQAIGLKRPKYDALAREICATITVNKSMAVVLGVAPLLAVNVLYTVYFYSANALTGGMWIGVVPLVTLAFLLSYAHKYTWDRFAQARRVHLAIGASAMALFLFIPLIFLANINLMLFPDRWADVKGFFSSLLLPNALPRYVHFLLACLALTALFLLLHFTRKGFPLSERLAGFDRPGLRRGLYGIAFGATLLQFAAGPLVYFTLPDVGISNYLIAIVILAVVLAAGSLGLMWWEITSSDERIGRLFAPVVTALMLTVFTMGYARHIYRENAVGGHRALMAAATEDFAWASLGAQWRAAGSLGDADVPVGQRIYDKICSGCHAIDKQIVGPPLTEIADLYAEHPEGIVAWTLNPGKKRPGMIQMPAFKLPEDQLLATAEYMIALGRGNVGATQPATMPAESAVPGSVPAE